MQPYSLWLTAGSFQLPAHFYYFSTQIRIPRFPIKYPTFAFLI